MMAWLGKIVSWVVVGLLLLVGWWWLNHAGTKKHDEGGRKGFVEVTVTTQTATERRVERRVSLVGYLQGIEEVTLTPKVEGRVKTLLHDVNASLAPDTPVLILDDVDLKLAEGEAQRALELELARVGLTADKLPARGKEEDTILATLPAVIRARNLEENAQRRLQRNLSVGGGTVAAEDLDQARTDLRVAQANYQQQMIESRSAIASAREKLARLHSAQQRLRDATLRVPVPSTERLAEIAQARGVESVTLADIRYVIAQRMVSEGEQIRMTSQGVLKLVLDRPLKLVATVPDRYLPEVQVGQPVWLQVAAYARQRFQGSVVRINPTIDRGNHTFTIEVSMPNEDRKLRAGMFCQASIQTRQEDTALVVPEEAVVSFAGVDKVFAVRDGKAHEVLVRLGERMETTGSGRRQAWLEIIGELRPGDQVATSGQTQLADGTPVRVRTSRPAE